MDLQAALSQRAIVFVSACSCGPPSFTSVGGHLQPWLFFSKRADVASTPAKKPSLVAADADDTDTCGHIGICGDAVCHTSLRATSAAAWCLQITPPASPRLSTSLCSRHNDRFVSSYCCARSHLVQFYAAVDSPSLSTACCWLSLRTHAWSAMHVRCTTDARACAFEP
jgi:hypothetical protein